VPASQPARLTNVTPDRPIRVLLVDDHAMVRRGLRGFLELLDDIEICGEAENGLQALDEVARLHPDVVLMDLLMPQLDGVGAIARLRAEHPDVEVVALTSFVEESRVTAALEAGASGFILKDADADDVAQAIRAAHRGEVHLDPAVALLVARRVRTARTTPTATADAALTDREREVLALVAHGLSNKAIADRLVITERTARTHVSNILGKLGLASRTQAALYAVEHGLAAPGPTG
jgi:DNA-binding NarL/FixJ family response regulator